jgi:hypothetical protein
MSEGLLLQYPPASVRHSRRKVSTESDESLAAFSCWPFYHPGVDFLSLLYTGTLVYCSEIDIEEKTRRR